MSDVDVCVGEVTTKSRTLILCFDGTSSEYDASNTNVVRFFSLLKKDDLDEQLCYYQAGIGTWFNPGVVSPIFQWGAKILDLAFAWYLDAHVIDGYRFLMQNYRPGDKICIFGFSRGAYTARALAGALYKVGLLPRDNEQQIPFAYKLYKREDKAGINLCAGFKQTFCRTVTVEFMGVWDTVSSVGVLMGRTLPFTNSNKSIKIFRHALSLDEHRTKFRPNYYHRPAPNNAGAVLDPEQGSPIITPDSPQSSSYEEQKLVKPKRAGILQRLSMKRSRKNRGYYLEEDGEVTDVMEVWFSGCHGDIGGGEVSNGTAPDLSNVTLRWMVREVITSQCGIQFENAALERASIPPSIFYEDALKPSTSCSALDEQDALAPLHDRLKMNVLWWILEILPLSYSWQDADGVWHRNFSPNLGKGRKIPNPKPNFHLTVKQRMADKNMKYTPKAQWTPGTENYLQ